MQSNYPFIFRIKSLNNHIKRLMERTAIAKNDANLTGMQYGILGFLSARKEQDNYQKDIESAFNIRRSTASGMVRLLEKDGYIRRESVPDDARLKKIILTDKALELDKVASTNMLELHERLINGISPEELEQFYKILDKMIKNAAE